YRAVNVGVTDLNHMPKGASFTVYSGPVHFHFSIFHFPLESQSERTSAAASDSNSQMRPVHSRCSGFISTERKQVIVSRSRFIPPRFFSHKWIGNSATARCSARLAAVSKTLRLRADDSLTLFPRGAKTKMSSCGAN